MRYLIVVVALLGAVFAGSEAAALTANDSGYTLALSQQPSAQLDVDVDINDGAGAWWTNPMWMAIGAIGLVLLILIIIMAARGGGTTVIKE